MDVWVYNESKKLQPMEPKVSESLFNNITPAAPRCKLIFDVSAEQNPFKQLQYIHLVLMQLRSI